MKTVRNNTYIVCLKDNEVKKANVNLLHVIKKVEEKIRMIRKVTKDNYLIKTQTEHLEIKNKIKICEMRLTENCTPPMKRLVTLKKTTF